MSVMEDDLPPRQFVGDLSQLPSHAHSHRSLTWWGMMGMIAIEGTAFALAIAAYLYLANHERHWPPYRLAPSLIYGTLFTIISLVSALPNIWLNRVAAEERLRPVQIGLVIMSLIGIALLVVRYFEFPALHVAWSDSAYGSITVTILGLHTVHLITDLIDTIVLTALMFTPHARGRRFVDVAENAIYWNFVVLAWIPIYALLYFAPRWL
ncbi:MAG: heme-copper oxidase subunit III [Povalibacter sp.]